VPNLVEAMGSKDLITRRRAIVALGHIGPAAKAAIDSLDKLSEHDPDDELRRSATLALYEINLAGIAADALGQAPPQVRLLAAKLLGTDQYEAVAAAKGLSSMGPTAAPAVASLAEALQSKNKWIREAAADALGAMGPAAQNVVPALLRAADDESSEVRDAALRSLGKLGVDSTTWRP
jgi:HEAT repeat protein